MMTRYSARPRAPSPPRSPTTSEEDANLSDNTYSVVQDNLSSSSSTPPAPPPKTRLGMPPAAGSARHHHPAARRQQQRHFGDSVDPSPTGSVLSDSPSTSSSVNSGGVEDLASLYQATRTGGRKTYDAVTVEQIKAQFQKQIEAMLQSQERHNTTVAQTTEHSPIRRPDNNRVKLQVASPPPPPKQSHHQHPLRSGHMQSTAERELSGIRDLQRGKSFAEARTAVQRHIERMLGEQNGGGGDGPPMLAVKRGADGGGVIKHAMHGVSHRQRDEDDIEPPPPTHYGVSQAIRDRNNNNSHGEGSSKWRSVESLLDNGDSERSAALSTPSMKRSAKFRSVDNLDSSAPSSLRRTVVEIDIEDDDERARRIKMEKGKPWAAPPIAAKTGGAVRQQETDASSTASSSSSSSPPEMTEAAVPRATAAKKQKEVVKHKVDYLGALPISPRATNLASLQRPLKDLYFKYRALRNLGQVNLPGTLEISDTGLTVQYIRELHKGVQEIFNPFPTIAVWAAVKFVHKREVVPSSGSVHHQFAFLPLISDPDNNQEKHHLYHDLDFHEVELAADAPHPPVFACVMRRTGVPKQLECHGFVCTSSEDAIIVAANLYQALLETMKRQRQDQARRQQRLARKQSLKRGKKVSVGSDLPPPPTVFSDSDSAAPVRPPRRKNKKGGRESGGSGASGLQRRKSQRSSIRSNRSNGKGPKRPSVTIDPTRRTARALARSESGRRSIRSNASGSNFARKSTRKSGRRANLPPKSPAAYGTQQVPAAALAAGNGDVYTRVAIPRSKSFMNVGSQYNLQELFRELKEKEGVESIDDVLKKVITPNGISFNEIKPVYRELLLKLAMTMSQDEIFQRSKNIIAQEKKKQKEGKKDKAKSKDSNGTGTGNESSSNTISSFFKMTFSSSSKSNSLASGGKSKNLKKKEQQHAQLSLAHNSSFEADSGLGSGHHELPKSSSSLAHGGTKAGREKASTIAKADHVAPPPHQSSLTKYASSRTPIMRRRTMTVAEERVVEESHEDPYGSCCSECGEVYESVCSVAACSCRVKEKPLREPVHSLKKGFQSEMEDHLPTILTKRPSVVEATTSRAQQQPKQVKEDDDSEIYCDCDAESCASSEKCYCSLRGHPAEQNHKHRTRVAIQHRHQKEEEEDETYHHHRTPNNTTIIHCGGGSGRDTIRSFSSVSSCSTCNFHTCESGSTATDTTCYSIKHHQPAAAAAAHHHHPTSERYNSHSSLLSGCESPQTAWSRNARLTSPENHHRQQQQQHRQQLHQHHRPASYHSEYSDASLARRMGSSKASASSVCRSSDSYTSCNSSSSSSAPIKGGILKKGNSVCGSSSCSNSSSNGSHRSGPLYQSGSRSSGGVKRATSKVLLVSATDKAGRVVYRGASSASNLTTLDENAAYDGGYDQHRPRSRHQHLHSSHGHLGTAAATTSDHGSGRHNGDAADASTNDRSSILSMKKSAEIAAVFSGARINQTTDIVDELRNGGSGNSDSESGSSCCGNSCYYGRHGDINGYSSDGGDSTDAAYATRKACPHCGGANGQDHQSRKEPSKSRNDMKSSLGYFP